MTPVEAGITRSIESSGPGHGTATGQRTSSRSACAVGVARRLTRIALTFPRLDLRWAFRRRTRGLNQIRREHPTPGRTSADDHRQVVLLSCGFLRRSKRNGSQRQSHDFISPGLRPFDVLAINELTRGHPAFCLRVGFQQLQSRVLAATRQQTAPVNQERPRRAEPPPVPPAEPSTTAIARPGTECKRRATGQTRILL